MLTPETGHYSQKLLICVCWSMKCVIHYELVEHGKIINEDIYCQQLDWVNEALRQKCSALINWKGFILQLDNSGEKHSRAKSVKPPTHNKKKKKKRLLEWDFILRPPSSPDLAGRDFHSFRSLEHFVSGRTFRNSFSNIFQVKKTKQNKQTHISLYAESKICLLVRLQILKRKLNFSYK